MRSGASGARRVGPAWPGGSGRGFGGWVSDLCRSAPSLRRPELLEIAGRSRESFAAEISLPAAEAPLVSVLVPALDHVEYTLCCLAAMCRHPPAASFEVVAIDAGSTDDSPRLLTLLSNLVYLRNETTQGFVRSINQAAHAARGRFLLLLNNDTQVQPGWLDELVAAFDDPDVGIAGSKLALIRAAVCRRRGPCCVPTAASSWWD